MSSMTPAVDLADVRVEPDDPATFGVIAVGLAVVAILACGVPARRAARTDAIAALRLGE